MIKVALLDDYQDIALKMADWHTLPDTVQVQAFQDHLTDEDALVERLRGCDIVMAMRERTPFPRSLLARLPNLKCISSAGIRNAAIDLEAATDLGILVCGAFSSPAPTAELTWGLILSAVRNIPAEVQATREGKWQTTFGQELNGKTLGLLGAGRIGTLVARVARAFEMRVLAWSPHLTPERAQAAGAEYAPLDDLLQSADIVSIHLKLGEGTRGLLGARELALLSPGAYLVNTSRGPIIEEAALIEALRSRSFAGAALDVFDREPLPAGHPLLTLDNALITPHLGGLTQDNRRRGYGGTLQNIQALLQGRVPEMVFNPEVLPQRRPLEQAVPATPPPG